MNRAKLFFLSIVISASGSALAQAAVEIKTQEQSPNFVLCRNQKTVRTIRVEKEDQKECVAFYTKAGVDREVGRAQNLLSCQKIVENIRGNLEKAAWKCTERGNVSIIAPEEGASKQ